MDLWDNVLAEDAPSPKIRMLLDGQNLIMFFTKEGEVYGCPEESRLTFARIKHPNPEDSDLDMARFSALNLYDALVGKSTENLFTKKDMKKIKIISEKKCAALLEKRLKKVGGKKPTKVPNMDRDQEDDRRPLRKEN